MIKRRSFIAGVACLVSTTATSALAHKNKSNKFVLANKYQPQTVRLSDHKQGTLVIDPRNHFLYLVLAGSKARRYGVGVGKAGLVFKGSATIGRKAKWPSWTPTANMIRREP